jgi:hypothetical protein
MILTDGMAETNHIMFSFIMIEHKSLNREIRQDTPGFSAQVKGPQPKGGYSRSNG